jgi:hypothetical protein
LYRRRELRLCHELHKLHDAKTSSVFSQRIQRDVNTLLQPCQLLLLILAGWINHREQEVI